MRLVFEDNKDRCNIVGQYTLAFLLATLTALPIQAQDPIHPTKAVWWGDLLTIPAVDSSQVNWLEQNADWQTATEVFRLVDKLSTTAAFQLLPSYYYADASYYYMTDRSEQGKLLQQLVEEVMVRRPPINESAYVHAAYTVLQSRQYINEYYEQRNDFQQRFLNRSLPTDLLPAASEQAATQSNIEITLRFATAENLLNYLETSAGNLERAEQYARTPLVHALMINRGASDYPMGASHEMIVDLLSKTGSDAEMSRLYQLANPYGNFHFTEVRNYVDQYTQVINRLKQHQSSIERYVEQALSPFVIQGAKVKRVIDITFGDGAETWTEGDITGISLEYFKDDYARLIRTMTHEAVHSMHQKFQQESNAVRIHHILQRNDASRMMQEFALSLDAVYREGVASYIQPPESIPDAEQINRASVAATQLDSLAQLYFQQKDNEGKAQKSAVQAMRSIRERAQTQTKPFYWLGKAMAAKIVDEGGEVALAQLLREDAMVFFDAYRQAVSDHQGMLSTRTWQFIVNTSQEIGSTR